MMNRIGLTSFALGGLAVPAAFAAVYVRAIHIPGDGVILHWLDKAGLVKRPVDSFTALSETSIFAINDLNAIGLLFAIAIFLAVSSIFCALFAEFRREPTLYLSAGYICAALGLFLMKPSAGVVSFVAGIAAILLLRHGRPVAGGTAKT